MKVALICPDGLSVLLFCKEIIRCLRCIPEAEVIVFCNPGEYMRDLKDLGVEVVPAHTSRFISPVKDLLYLIRLCVLLKSKGVDYVFNIIASKQNIYGSFAGYLAGANTIVSWVNGLGQVFNERSGVKEIFLRKLVSQLYKCAINLNSKVWFNNPSDADYFVENKLVSRSKSYLSRFFLDISFYSSSSVSLNELEAVRQKLQLSSNERVVVMVARMIWQKGIREFAEASKKLYHQYPNVRFLLIAPLECGHIDSVPESYVESFEKRFNFTWLRFEKDVRPYYAISTLAVLPSYYKEGGYPRALLEPMAMGKAIVATDTEGCRRTVEHGLNGFLIPPRDADSLAATIVRLMNDDSLAERMGRYSELKARREFDERQIVCSVLRQLGLAVPVSTMKQA